MIDLSRRALAPLVVAAALLIPAAVPAVAQEASPSSAGSAATAVPPGGDPLGVPYGEWGQRWWQWLISTPSTTNPIVTGDCQAGQAGDVFFIPHTFPGESTTVACAIGPDQWVLASAGGVIWDNADGCCETAEDFVAAIEADRPTFSNPAVIVDGVEVPDIESYYVMSPLFEAEYIEDNIFGYEPATHDAMVGGWFVMIPPLAPGEHTIVVRDDIDDLSDEAGPQTAELTAEVTVEAG
jgi:hypothetical protein